ncbi:MAG: SsrA-binding protein, partial [Candidatus Peregrinibacteria bacterium]|nr:SsrA-binding protein [Candidatus Peregrinibacteria bacterium]
MKIIYQNKKALFDYEILDEFKAGIILLGPEIKSIRLGHVNLKGAYVSLKDARAFLKGA